MEKIQQMTKKHEEFHSIALFVGECEIYTVNMVDIFQALKGKKGERKSGHLLQVLLSKGLKRLVYPISLNYSFEHKLTFFCQIEMIEARAQDNGTYRMSE